ncbi:MAG: ABC transporter permease [Gordonia sp. (in: high G+C Gram-positive bacteria)]
MNLNKAINLHRIKILCAENGTIVALAVLLIVFTVLNPRFISTYNIETIVLSMAEIGLIAIPLALLVMTGSIDLSVGSVASLGAVAGTLTMKSTGVTWLGIIAGIVVGVVAGLFNALFVELLNLNPLVVTLGFLNVWGGLALYLTNGRTISGLPDDSRAIGQWTLFGSIPLTMVLLVAAIMVAWLVLNYSPFGRQILAVGGNSRAAFLMGINVRGVRIKLFVLTGAVSGFAGVLMALKLQSASPSLGSGFEFTALTVVLLGGVTVAGGQGKISGVVAGLLFVGALKNGLVILGISQFLQTMIVGLTLVIAVSLDESMQRVMRSAWNSLAKQKQPPAQSDVLTTEPHSTQTTVS